MSTYTNEADIAVLKSKVEDLEENQTILFERIRTNEKWIAGAGAVLTVAMAILGLVAAVDAKTTEEINQTISQGTRAVSYTHLTQPTKCSV